MAFFITSLSAHAVNDTAHLVGGSTTPPQDEGLESGRYQTKSSATAFEPMQPASKKIKKAHRRISSEPVKPVQAEVKVEAKPDAPAEPAVEPPSYADQVKDLITGKSQPQLEAYVEQVHPDDVRLNKLEINVSPGILYVESKSTYSFRDYTSFSPFARVGGEVWWTPFIGLFGNYGASVGADVIEDSSLQSRKAVNIEIIDGGIEFRKFFGLSRRSNSINVGAYYFEYKFGPKSDSTMRTRTKSNGLGIQFSARFPVAPSYAWIIGAKMAPRISHSEFGTTLGLQSGSDPESSRFALNVGGEFKLSRNHQLIWDLSSAIEKNQYSGMANTTDPKTGVMPSGVSVTNTISLFTLGYRWGN